MIRLKYARGENAVTTIKRSEFGVDKDMPMTSDEVKVLIQLETT